MSLIRDSRTAVIGTHRLLEGLGKKMQRMGETGVIEEGGGDQGNGMKGRVTRTATLHSCNYLTVIYAETRIGPRRETATVLIEPTVQNLYRHGN